jgi:phosphoketolase
MIWHVVVNADRTALAVYGEALLSEANEKTAKLQADFPSLTIRTVTVRRPVSQAPHVGEHVGEP